MEPDIPLDDHRLSKVSISLRMGELIPIELDLLRLIPAQKPINFQWPKTFSERYSLKPLWIYELQAIVYIGFVSLKGEFAVSNVRKLHLNMRKTD